jgi:dienelactone hydrolase
MPFMTYQFTPGRRSLAKGVLAGAVTPLLGTDRASATSHSAPTNGPLLRLPAPDGPYLVGATTLHLVDPSRNDPWEPMVTVLRPTAPGHGFPRSPQLTPAAAALFTAIAPRIHPQLPASGVDWAAILTHARTGAPPLPGRRPVLLYSPGGGDARTTGSSLAVDLASHGWTVLTVDHPGDASQVEFPDERPGRERLRPTALHGPPDAAAFRTMIDTRVADLRFVLDALGLDRVGVYGHSAGGTAAAQVLHEDRRIAAAVNLEGYLDQMDGEPLPVARQGTDRPLLLAGTDGFRDARLDDFAHWAFTDYASLVPQLQGAGLMTAAGRAAMVGRADPRLTVPAVRDLVRTFFARHVPR